MLWLFIHAVVVCDRSWCDCPEICISIFNLCIYTHMHKTFFWSKKERPVVESAIYCHVQSWQGILSSWRLPSHVGISFFSCTQQLRELICISIYCIPFVLFVLVPQWAAWVGLVATCWVWLHFINAVGFFLYDNLVTLIKHEMILIL